MKKILFSSILTTIMTFTTAYAFDEQKEGLILSLGAGIATIKTDIQIGEYGTTESSFALASCMKIGYGITNQFLLFYVDDISWYKNDNVSWYGYDNEAKNDIFINTLTGVEINYYLYQDSPYYLTGAVGVSIIENIAKNEASRGSAFSIGAGYEVFPHFLIESKYLSTVMDDDKADVTTGVFRVTANYMWY